MDSKNSKILIADDSLLARKRLKDCLISLGYENIIEAQDGAEAVEQYHKENPDLVFMDIVMPKQFGTDTVKEIIATNPEAIIIMLSSVGRRFFKGRRQRFYSKAFYFFSSLCYTRAF